MMLIGLDFDNTLISYDSVFHAAALEKGFVPADLPANKTLVRDHMRAQGLEEEWIHLQGEVYGARITEAVPFPGMMDALKKLQDGGVDLVLVSHKTRTPYRGPQYDLHQAARTWLEQQGFFSAAGLGWDRGRVFFEEAKADKIDRIVQLGCTHYVDDLPEILDMLPETMCRILFDPSGVGEERDEWRVLRSWDRFEAVVR